MLDREILRTVEAAAIFVVGSQMTWYRFVVHVTTDHVSGLNMWIHWCVEADNREIAERMVVEGIPSLREMGGIYLLQAEAKYVVEDVEEISADEVPRLNPYVSKGFRENGT